MRSRCERRRATRPLIEKLRALGNDGRGDGGELDSRSCSSPVCALRPTTTARRDNGARPCANTGRTPGPIPAQIGSGSALGWPHIPRGAAAVAGRRDRQGRPAPRRRRDRPAGLPVPGGSSGEEEPVLRGTSTPRMIASWDGNPEALEPPVAGAGWRDYTRLSQLLEAPVRAAGMRDAAKPVYHLVLGQRRTQGPVGWSTRT